MPSTHPEEQQFKTIYEESHDFLQRYLFRLTRNREDTADLLQETFLRLYEQESYPASYKAWLYQTGYRLFIDQWRRKKRVQWVSLECSPLLSNDATPELSYIQYETRAQIESNLNQLSSKQRMIFMLKYNEGASYQQIGNHIGCPENTVKCLVRRARIHLWQMAERDNERMSG
ncbi:MAG: RNA polymerase sigma factor [Paenibacillaceae bacterium]